MKLSVLIKTFNEEAKLARCLDSVIEAVRGIDGGVEIVVADSLSTDGTIDVARRYPIKIVQLSDGADRGCGTGVQLGFQHAAGQYVYLLDGDMELQRPFLLQALELLEREQKVAGVSGILQDSAIRNRFDQHRLKTKPSAVPGEVNWLGGGGLYRRAALQDAGGYAGNRNLKAFEEAELGLRLRSRGWRLMRLPVTAIVHTGHADSTFGLIARHWRSGRMNAGGVLLKSSLGRPWFFRVIRMFIHPLAVLAYWLAWIAALAAGGDWRALATLAMFGPAVYLALAVKKRSLVDAGFSVLLWHVAALGILKGIWRRQQSPLAAIPSVVLSEGKHHGYGT